MSLFAQKRPDKNLFEYSGNFLKCLFECAKSVSKIKKLSFKTELFVCNLQVISVIELGFEPRTVCLEGRCSIQLSYSTIPILVGAKINDFLNFQIL